MVALFSLIPLLAFSGPGAQPLYCVQDQSLHIEITDLAIQEHTADSIPLGSEFCCQLLVVAEANRSMDQLASLSSQALSDKVVRLVSLSVSINGRKYVNRVSRSLRNDGARFWVVGRNESDLRREQVREGFTRLELTCGVSFFTRLEDEDVGFLFDTPARYELKLGGFEKCTATQTINVEATPVAPEDVQVLKLLSTPATLIFLETLPSDRPIENEVLEALESSRRLQPKTKHIQALVLSGLATARLCKLGQLASDDPEGFDATGHGSSRLEAGAQSYLELEGELEDTLNQNDLTPFSSSAWISLAKIMTFRARRAGEESERRRIEDSAAEALQRIKEAPLSGQWHDEAVRSLRAIEARREHR